MILLDVIVALATALLFASILYWVVGLRGPGPLAGFLFFLVLLFLTVWAGGIWVRPALPDQWGLAWFGFLGVGLLAALLIAALIAPYTGQQKEISAQVFTFGFGLFFYLVMFAFLASIALRYFTWYPAEP